MTMTTSQNTKLSENLQKKSAIAGRAKKTKPKSIHPKKKGRRRKEAPTVDPFVFQGATTWGQNRAWGRVTFRLSGGGGENSKGGGGGGGI